MALVQGRVSLSIAPMVAVLGIVETDMHQNSTDRRSSVIDRWSSLIKVRRESVKGLRSL